VRWVDAGQVFPIQQVAAYSEAQHKTPRVWSETRKAKPLVPRGKPIVLGINRQENATCAGATAQPEAIRLRRVISVQV
jgi:hypothetical protein